MEAKDVKWCPQHGYPLPCYKCGMPLSQLQQKEIYEAGVKAGIKEVVEWVENEGVEVCLLHCEPSRAECPKCWQAQLKKWGVDV